MNLKVDIYNYKQALAGLVRHSEFAITFSPCPLKTIVNHILAEGDATSYEAVYKGILLVSRAHPYIVVLEKEKCARHFFMFLYQAPLLELAAVVFGEMPQTISNKYSFEIEPVLLPPKPKPTVAVRPKKKKPKKKAAQQDQVQPPAEPQQQQQQLQQQPEEQSTEQPAGQPSTHVISNNIESLRELANDILGKQSSQLTNNVAWIKKMLQEPSALEQEAINARIEKLAPYVGITEICESNSWNKCLELHKGKCAHKIHFERVIDSHTDPSLGDCAYLDSCFKGKMCRFVHYSIRLPKVAPPARIPPRVQNPGMNPAQVLNADILKLDLKLLGNDFKAVIIDPPWEIHTNPVELSGCSDMKIAGLDIGSLQTSGVVFLWVTGRVLDFGRRCLERWGYTHIEEIIWLKTNQLCRTICTGRTGHWLNHTKEHVLVGVKGENASFGLQLDTDVILSHALGKSQKPTELYAIIDRLVGPESKKLELFGRPSNRRDGWLTVGNEMRVSQLHDEALKARLGLR